jgi:hypothetical protein
VSRPFSLRQRKLLFVQRQRGTGGGVRYDFPPLAVTLEYLQPWPGGVFGSVYFEVSA